MDGWTSWYIIIYKNNEHNNLPGIYFNNVSGML